MSTQAANLRFAARRLGLWSFTFTLTGCLAAPSLLAGEPQQEDSNRRGAAALLKPRNERTGWFAGASAGVSRYHDHEDANDDGSLGSLDADNADLGWSVFGGYNFLPYLGVQASYVDIGESSFDAKSSGGPSWAAGDVSASVEASGWSIGATGRCPLGERWTPFATVGLFQWKTKEVFTENGFRSTDEDSGSHVTYGLGAEYDLGKPEAFVVRGEVDRREVDDDKLRDDTFNGGLVYQF